MTEPDSNYPQAQQGEAAGPTDEILNFDKFHSALRSVKLLDCHGTIFLQYPLQCMSVGL